MESSAPVTALSDSEFDARTRAILGAIETQLDLWLQEDIIDIDAHRTGGLLEMAFPNGSKIVVNTQPPLHELWLAARQGGFHFKFADAHWRDTRNGGEFFEVLSTQASEQAGRPLRFVPPAQS